MKRIAIILLIIMFFATEDVCAQHHRGRSRVQVIKAYPSLGATTSQIRGDELRGFKRWGFTAGVGAEMNLSTQWKLSVEADFSQRGIQNNTLDPYGVINFTMNYVDIPLTVHFTDPYGGITLGLGLVYGRLVQQPHGILLYSPTYFMPDTGDMSFLKNDISAAFDVRFPVWRGLTLNFRWQHSLIPVKRDWHFTEHYSAAYDDFKTWSNDCYNSSISLRLLYVFGEDKGSFKSKSRNFSRHKKKKNRR